MRIVRTESGTRYRNKLVGQGLDLESSSKWTDLYILLSLENDFIKTES